MMMNERDGLMDVLMQEKDIVKVYGAFLTEATDPELRKLLEKHLVAQAKDQYKVFETMRKLNYATPKTVSQTEVEEERKSFEKMLKN